MNKAVFLDRDGTINVEKNYLYKIEDFVFLPGVIEGLKLLQDAGFLLIIITNQSGIARGYYTEEDFKILNNWMLNKLAENGINITKVYYCPHLPDAKIEEYRRDCDCRKPKLGLFYRAIKEYNIDIGKS
ncbi:MAG: HAD family hydrolase, partial [Lachnospiraceae bacterium]|nr:HAD family hydrolase [Lachnospiraceae bacterium]